MATETHPVPVVIDRRQVYRPFLESLNPIASPGIVAEHNWIVSRSHDPRNAEEPPIHESLATSAELSRGIQMALVGGIGSGKTTGLLLTRRMLSRHADAVNIYVDLAEYADLSQTNPGAILAVAGILLYAHLRTAHAQMPEDVESANEKLRELAFGKTVWAEPWDGYDEDSGQVQVERPGLTRPRLPDLREEVGEVKKLLLLIAEPLIESDAQVTFLIDGLDRLIHPERFREFAEQDLQALKGTKISVIIAAPLLMWYDKTRFLQDYFDVVKHIPAAAAGPEDSAFLKSVLERRRALEIMDSREVSSIAKYSGGVLRDLLTLARSAAEYAYRDAEDRVGRSHVNTAIKQLGNRYAAGLGSPHKLRLRRLSKEGVFRTDDPTSRELLVNRQVVEYVKGGREHFLAHPALAKVLPKPE